MHTVIIAGDYVMPMHTWSISKSFAVPVMKFNSDPRSKDYLKPIAFYDFGLLYLNRLPKDGIVLASRIGGTLADIWAQKAKRPAAGNLMHKLPASRVNTYVSAAEFDMFGGDENMSRVPVGSTHFIAGSFWQQGYRSLTHLVTIPKISRVSLINLYLGQGEKGQVLINTLDRYSFDGKSGSHDEFAKFAATGDCASTGRFDGLTPETFVETEVIVGMESGRKLLLENDFVNVFACDAFKDEDSQ